MRVWILGALLLSLGGCIQSLDETGSGDWVYHGTLGFDDAFPPQVLTISPQGVTEVMLPNGDTMRAHHLIFTQAATEVHYWLDADLRTIRADTTCALAPQHCTKSVSWVSLGNAAPFGMGWHKADEAAPKVPIEKIAGGYEVSFPIQSEPFYHDDMEIIATSVMPRKVTMVGANLHTYDLERAGSPWWKNEVDPLPILQLPNATGAYIKESDWDRVLPAVDKTLREYRDVFLQEHPDADCLATIRVPPASYQDEMVPGLDPRVTQRVEFGAWEGTDIRSFTVSYHRAFQDEGFESWDDGLKRTGAGCQPGEYQAAVSFAEVLQLYLRPPSFLGWLLEPEEVHFGTSFQGVHPTSPVLRFSFGGTMKLDSMVVDLTTGWPLEIRGFDDFDAFYRAEAGWNLPWSARG